jgi:hypothetical protein
MKRNIISFFLFVVLSLTLMSISAMAQATNTTTVEKVPVSGVFTACNGEDVPYEGTFNIVSHMTVSSSGQVSIKVGISGNLKGVGLTTGAKYVSSLNAETGVRADSIDLAPFNATVTVHLNFNGQGNLPMAKLKVLVHITVNAKGDITSEKFEMTDECK